MTNKVLVGVKGHTCTQVHLEKGYPELLASGSLFFFLQVQNGNPNICPQCLDMLMLQALHLDAGPQLWGSAAGSLIGPRRLVRT